MTPRLEDFLQADDALCSFSGAFNAIVERINDPTSSVADITEAIELDPTVAAKTLRLANSSLYGFPQEIETLHRAVAIIGLQQIRQIVLSTVVIEHFRGLPVIGVDMSSFWRHSLATAIIARGIARFRREANVDRLYLFGLLHDIGRLVLFLRLGRDTEELINLRERDGELLFVTEQRFLGFDHATIGSGLLEQWGMTPAHVEATRYHHDPLAAPAFPVEAGIVHVADAIANALRLGSSGERMVPPVHAEAFERIGLEMAACEEIADTAREQLDQLARILLD
ncbi:HDOD domain-containing protein [Thioalkalivibrio sp. ALE19]|uniref:HDOD domain-containing protein n=1 Tax=Thioalkalivibrio sp. ALE19 TaxID=1266909 RepID=UPI00040F591D|nr:HDOD domain-containing protein [Thioalkalivibrio sp. ALE19]